MYYNIYKDKEKQIKKIKKNKSIGGQRYDTDKIRNDE